MLRLIHKQCCIDFTISVIVYYSVMYIQYSFEKIGFDTDAMLEKQHLM